jgi:putative ABC transport system ATP-binding protein
MTAQRLTGSGLRYDAGGQRILDDVSVNANAGRLLAVCGPSGAGKSSLLALLGGLLTPSVGRVVLDDSPVKPGDQAMRLRISMVLQGYGLASALTARENVAITLQARRVSRDQVRQRTESALVDVDLADVADHLIEDMSGGQQQRVAVARALAARPDVLLADEPTAELDAENRERIVDLLVRLGHSGAIVVIASHDPEVVSRCDDVLEMDGGRVVTTG